MRRGLNRQEFGKYEPQYPSRHRAVTPFKKLFEVPPAPAQADASSPSSTPTIASTMPWAVAQKSLPAICRDADEHGPKTSTGVVPSGLALSLAQYPQQSSHRTLVTTEQRLLRRGRKIAQKIAQSDASSRPSSRFVAVQHADNRLYNAAAVAQK